MGVYKEMVTNLEDSLTVDDVINDYIKSYVLPNYTKVSYISDYVFNSMLKDLKTLCEMKFKVSDEELAYKLTSKLMSYLKESN